MVEEDIWKELENLKDIMDLVKEFEKKIRKKEKREEKKKILNPKAEMFKRSKLLEKHIAKISFEWDNEKFEDKYLKKLEKSWMRWKEKERQVPLETESKKVILL